MLSIDIIGEETVGPRGFANALRTVPVMLDLAGKMEKYAPDALLINLTNPASIVQQAIEQETNVKVISICDLPVEVVKRIANSFKVKVSNVKVDFFGLNHLGWYRKIWIEGKEQTENILEKVEELRLGISRELINSLGLIPLPFLKYYYHSEEEVKKAKAINQSKASRAIELNTAGEQIRQALEEEPEKMPQIIHQRGAIWYSDGIVPLIVAIVNNHPQEFIINVSNNGIIPELDDNVIIEVPAIVDATGSKPIYVSKIPLQVKGLIQQEANYRTLATQAALTQNPEDIIIALINNPQVPSYEKALQIWENELKPKE